MAAWPYQLPPPALNTFREALPDNRLRSNMDKGPAKVRRRSTANIAPMSFSLNLTDSQWAILKTFFNDTTFGGTEVFDFDHPKTGEPLRCRFVEVPEASDREGVINIVPISLEVMP